MDGEVFEVENIEFVSERTYSFFVWIQRLILLITYISFALLIYVVFKSSPKRIGNYKWYIIINATLGTLFETLNVGFALYPLLPYPIIVAHGFADIFVEIFHKPPELLTRLIIVCWFYCVIFLVHSTTSMFIYRYLQTTQNLDLLRLASNMKLYLLSYLVVGVVCSLLIILPINLQLLSNEELLMEMQKVDNKTYSYMKGHVSIGFNTKTGSYYLFSGINSAILLLFCGLTMSTSTIFCYRYLRQNKYMLSTKACALFKALINMLVIDLFFGTVVGGVMTTSCFLFFITHSKSGSLVVLMAFTLTELYPLCSHLIVLVYIEPFRQSVFRVLRLKRFVKVSEIGHPEIYSSTHKSIIFVSPHNTFQ